MKNAMRKSLRFVSLILVVLIAATVLSLTACGSNDENSANPETKSFTFTVLGPDGKEESFLLESDAGTVGEALEAEGLILGEEGPYGLYVKTVNGVTLDYDKDGMFWAFYVNGESSMTGVDKTDLSDGAAYAFKAEK